MILTLGNELHARPREGFVMFEGTPIFKKIYFNYNFFLIIQEIAADCVRPKIPIQNPEHGSEFDKIISVHYITQVVSGVSQFQ